MEERKPYSLFHTEGDKSFLIASCYIYNHCQKLLKAKQPTEPSASKTKQVGGDIPDPGNCFPPQGSVCGKLKAQRRTKPAI